MKKIISVSRRTDIPAFYSEWFMDRVRAGYCTVVNPYNANQVSRVSLEPEDVEIFVFWTRDPSAIIKSLTELTNKGYKFYFQYTILGYPKEIDPYSPILSNAVKKFKELSGKIGKEKVIWRYDPILLSNFTDVEWHKERFTGIMEELSGNTERVVISVIDPYQKTNIRMNEETPGTFMMNNDAFEPEAYDRLFEHMGGVAKEHGVEIQTCAEFAELEKYGIVHGKCIDGDLIARITGRPSAFKKDPSQRKACGCAVSKDIGANNTCLFGCKYCYATRKLEQARENFKKHDPKSPSLIGWYDVEPKKEEKKDVQLDLF